MQVSYRTVKLEEEHHIYPEVVHFQQYDLRTGQIINMLKLGIDKKTVEILSHTSIEDETEMLMFDHMFKVLSIHYRNHEIVHRIYDDVNKYLGHFIMWGFDIKYRMVGAVSKWSSLERKGYTLQLNRNRKQIEPPCCSKLNDVRAQTPIVSNDLLPI